VVGTELSQEDDAEHKKPFSLYEKYICNEVTDERRFNFHIASLITERNFHPRALHVRCTFQNDVGSTS